MIITEPVAAALAYGAKYNSSEDSRYIMVYDFGGGTLDVTILQLTQGACNVLTIAGDNHLGGQDIDVLLLEWAIEQWNSNNPSEGMQITEDKKFKRQRAKLRATACEVKELICSNPDQNEQPMFIENLLDGENFEYYLTRAEFEERCKPIFNRAMDPIGTALQEAKLNPNQISDVLLVGGSTRIPKIVERIQARFKHLELSHVLHKDHAIG